MDLKTDRRPRKIKTKKTIHLLLTAVVFLGTAAVCSAQNSQSFSPPRIDLLTLNGGKPNLSATGEGITAYKTTHIYKPGTMRVRLVKPADVKFKIDLPAGYTVFNDLIYEIETDTVFSGPHDIIFHLPSARTKETFAELRILFPEHDYADPDLPKWRDATLDDAYDSQHYLSDAALKERLRDFKSRTLHAFTEKPSLFFVVAVRDTTKLRDNFTADLELTGTVNPQVTEGRTVTYELKVTNKGPDTATGIALKAQPGFEFVSVEASQGKCRMAAQNVYCKFASLEKNRSIDVKIVERCEWDRHFPTGLSDPQKPNAEVSKYIRVGADEPDSSYDNNEVHLMTEVLRDENKGPVIEILNLSRPFQLFDGPSASVPIRFKASDPDGYIKKVELFDLSNGKSLGEPTLRSEGEYELIYKDVPHGRHWIGIVATDNLDRLALENTPEIFVNGPAKVEVISPKPGSTMNRTDDEMTITIRANSPSSPLKRVSLSFWDIEATPIGNDLYVVKVRYCARKCRLQAIAVDENGVETRSEQAEVLVLSPPIPSVRWYDGEFLQPFESGKTLKTTELVLVASAQHENQMYAAEIRKIEIFIDGKVACTDNQPEHPGLRTDCVWRPAPGRYKLHVVATDVDGAVGKSEVIEVVIERP